MDIKQKLQEVGDYFKQKVIAGEYEVIGISPHTASIEIDGEYKFKLWISTSECYLDFYFIMPEEVAFIAPYLKFTEEEQSNIWNQLQPKVIEWRRDVRAQEIEDSIKHLTGELEQLKSKP